MAEIVCLAFDRIDTADKVLGELQLLQQVSVLELADACVVTRSAAGAVHFKQSVNLVAGGTVGGGALGAFCGTLVGLLLFNPLAGLLVGAGVGAATGAISSALSDYGIDDDFIKSLGSTITPGGSALFMLVRPATAESLLAPLEKYRAVLLQTSLDDEQERRLRAALATAAEASRISQPVA